MTEHRPVLFRGRHFEDVIIILCVRWYLRYSLSYRDLEEMMTERRLSVDHVTVWRWVPRYAPILNQRMRCRLGRPNRPWRVDETCDVVSSLGCCEAGGSPRPECYTARSALGATASFFLRKMGNIRVYRVIFRMRQTGSASQALFRFIRN